MMMHCNLLRLTKCSSCWPCLCILLFLSFPLFPYPHSSSNTDICTERDACVSVSHSFPWSLVLCWLCSCFPLRSGTPDDGRPRYELCSFFQRFPHLSLLLPLCSEVCVRACNSYLTSRLEASDMGCQFTYTDWPAFYSRLCCVAICFHLSFFLIILIYFMFFCLLGMWLE